MKRVLVPLLCFVFSFLSAHNLHDESVSLTKWNPKNTSTIEGTFLKYSDGKVTFELEDHSTKTYNLTDFSTVEQSIILEKYKKIANLNQPLVTASKSSIWESKVWKASLLLSVLLGFLVSMKFNFLNINYKLSQPLFAVFSILVLSAFSYKMLNGTDPKVMDEAFKPFKPNVNTRWDNQYFYVESKGIPTTHDMMKGITAWQQQVPIPQCYVGANAWSIPLNPEIAATPVPVNQMHFLRGAIAIAVNGIAIFNPYTNTGVDAFLDGQLDNWGGHCGRADDYHYHNAPLHLYDHTVLTLPIAYALDGFAIYGSKEPDGSNMKALDANHGHYDNGVYHYHGTATAPYMIGNMVGKVTEDTTLQIVPQAAAKPIRPSLTPLKGAVLTSCVPNANKNGYTLNYTLNNQNYSVDYNWANGKNYIFNFVSPTGTTTATYNGYVNCVLPTAINEIISNEQLVSIFPNPSSDRLTIQLKQPGLENEFKKMQLFTLDGKKMMEISSFTPTIDLNTYPKGTYCLKLQFESGMVIKKIIIE
jgi:hypothetical protein